MNIMLPENAVSGKLFFNWHMVTTMVTPESIQFGIAQGMKTAHLSVTGDGQHFEAIVVSEEFAGKNRIARHQLVFQTLGERMRGEIHALSIKTYTPEEWEKNGK